LCKEQVIDKSGLFCEILEVFRTLNISITQEAFFICSQKNSTMTIDRQHFRTLNTLFVVTKECNFICLEKNSATKIDDIEF
jgi:hypothetical protein